MRAVVDVLALLRSLPVLSRILPLPGTAQTHAASSPARGVDQKVLTRVRALLAKAESTGFPEEPRDLGCRRSHPMSRRAVSVVAVGADRR
ncbi:MAG: DUF2786 domain-containing protein [Pseudonocardiaceae bacterium]